MPALSGPHPRHRGGLPGVAMGGSDPGEVLPDLGGRGSRLGRLRVALQELRRKAADLGRQEPRVHQERRKVLNKK